MALICCNYLAEDSADLLRQFGQSPRVQYVPIKKPFRKKGLMNQRTQVPCSTNCFTL
jgi:hypothetical protein